MILLKIISTASQKIKHLHVFVIDAYLSTLKEKRGNPDKLIFVRYDGESNNCRQKLDKKSRKYHVSRDVCFQPKQNKPEKRTLRFNKS